jgi:hypothetical protein
MCLIVEIPNYSNPTKLITTASHAPTYGKLPATLVATLMLAI